MDFCTALAAAIEAAPTSDAAATLKALYEQACKTGGGTVQPQSGGGGGNTPPPTGGPGHQNGG